jgi:hypothetical protein
MRLWLVFFKKGTRTWESHMKMKAMVWMMLLHTKVTKMAATLEAETGSPSASREARPLTLVCLLCRLAGIIK